jgi:hypothetical protein
MDGELHREACTKMSENVLKRCWFPAIHFSFLVRKTDPTGTLVNHRSNFM